LRTILAAALILTSVSFSDTATQTDWSGGCGVLGPVTDWGNNYYSADHISDAGSLLCLASDILTTPVEHIVDGYFYGVRSVYAADVDGDDDTDVLGAARYGDDITWWENTDGTGTVWTVHTVDGDFNGATSVYTADVDGDSDVDVLGAADMADDIAWWENTDGSGTAWTKHTVDDDFNGAASVYSADVDGDGDRDVLGAGYIDNEISWWENTDGTGTVWTKHNVSGLFSGARSVFATDLNGDGDMDVLGAAAFGGISWWENTDGAGTVWTERTVDGSFEGAVSVYATDVDGDGVTDVVGAGYMANEIAWWENTDGTGTVWTKHTVNDHFRSAYSTFAADVDGDGDTDVLGAARYGDDITWWENTDGTGTSWIEHTVDGAFDYAIAVYAADVDGNGDTDVLGASQNEDDIRWWDVMGYSAAGSLESSILDANTVDFWELFISNEQKPIGTSVGFQFRSSQDSASMGVWSDTVFNTVTDLSGILADSTDFVQYRVILQTADPAVTPELFDVAVSYTSYLSIGDTNPEGVTYWDLESVANPSFGNLSIHVSVPQSAIVDLLLYDVTGRIIFRYSQELPGGEHSVYFNNLHEGVYFCTMRAGDFTATERIVVLK